MQSVLLTKLASEKLSIWVSITMMFTYTILLDRNFACTCKSQGLQCGLYLILPFLIILLLILWTDRSFQRVCRYLCSYAECLSDNCCNFLCSALLHILKAVLVGLLWVAFVLLEGDWYVCCVNNHSGQQASLSCKAVGNITEKEKETIAELKNWSRVIGGIGLTCIVLVASLIPLCQWKKCFGEKCCEGKSSCCNRRFLFDKLILEEEDNVLKEILRKSAKDKLTEEVKGRIRGGQWEKCFNIAVDLINAKPTTSEEQQPLRARDADNQKLQVQQEEDIQHEEQEDRDDNISQQSTKI